MNPLKEDMYKDFLRFNTQIEGALKIINSLQKEAEKYIRIIDSQIVAVVAVYQDEKLYLQTRKTYFALARHYLRYYLHSNTTLTLMQIAQITGCKDHATVINSIKKHNELIATKNKVYREIITMLNAKIKAQLNN